MAVRDKIVAAEQAQKHKESETRKEFAIRMLEAQMTDLSNNHIRKLDEQLTRFKKVIRGYEERT
jgi:predicted outer membrane protein